MSKKNQCKSSKLLLSKLMLYAHQPVRLYQGEFLLGQKICLLSPLNAAKVRKTTHELGQVLNKYAMLELD